jgi:hypothetical protein
MIKVPEDRSEISVKANWNKGVLSGKTEISVFREDQGEKGRTD